ncbi:2-phospho-L-lactate guanylyltransferase [Catenuloplanes atrovinosus]|uniref:Phosphoenolpyruvate guanylyltransferase n=1 Tax=Catenuloplanes atrovinosus TaxID=137266 RepID=A0AAE4C7B0_9ACTN|nr:2-phospho-L-lactate guanylyltransferase [Catenuloplanes atrovinosus]MDR7273267.1 2-phospho-L-lactate guanylyltransferase [Catenuloplanes atrovinosus]
MQTWSVVIPVKPVSVGKSRLRGAVPEDAHERLALALARDTVAAVLACPEVGEVLVVTDDPVVAGVVTALGARVAPDAPAAGLNPAIRYGESGLPARSWRAALTADLPALRPEELGAALRAASVAPERRRFASDAPGVGTVLLTAPPGVPLDPRFGGPSAAAHAASGAVPLTGDWPSLRRDVDTGADLSAAHRLGVGAHTSALVAAPCGPGSIPC